MENKTRKEEISFIKYVMKGRSNINVKWNGNIYEYIVWKINKWNMLHPGNQITAKSIGLTEDLRGELQKTFFKEKTDEIKKMHENNDFHKLVIKKENVSPTEVLCYNIYGEAVTIDNWVQKYEYLRDEPGAKETDDDPTMW